MDGQALGRFAAPLVVCSIRESAVIVFKGGYPSLKRQLSERMNKKIRLGSPHHLTLLADTPPPGRRRAGTAPRPAAARLVWG